MTSDDIAKTPLALKVRERLHQLNKKPNPTSIEAGLGKDFIRDILIGRKKSVYGDNLDSLARVLQVSPDWLVSSDDARDGETAPMTPARPAPGSVMIPQLDIRFGMGGGAHYDAPVEATPMAFSEAWLSQITSTRPEHLFWGTGFGDSMYPTIGDRDILLVDKSQREPRIRDQIWALNQYGQGMIKRLRATANGYDILSDNPQVPTETASDGSMEVIGRVVAIVRRV